PDEIGALAMHVAVIATCEIAFRPLDLDHPRAGIGKPAGRLWRRHRLFKRHHEKTGKGEGHGFRSLARTRWAPSPSNSGLPEFDTNHAQVGLAQLAWGESWSEGGRELPGCAAP